MSAGCADRSPAGLLMSDDMEYCRTELQIAKYNIEIQIIVKIK